MKTVDKASPKLMLAVATGERARTVQFDAVRTGELEPMTYLTIKLTDVLVTSYQVGGSGAGGTAPTESLSLNFTKIEFEYKPQSPDGKLGSPEKACYDLAKAKKC